MFFFSIGKKVQAYYIFNFGKPSVVVQIECPDKTVTVYVNKIRLKLLQNMFCKIELPCFILRLLETRNYQCILYLR